MNKNTVANLTYVLAFQDPTDFAELYVLLSSFEARKQDEDDVLLACESACQHLESLN